ncbi:MAG TPA: FAD-dependent oxidoreductase, partial [Thermoanaerobaculia bacterium]|nr:FAD-dependent oxidoreductase [Thermoanaerobaculia bacterium]
MDACDVAVVGAGAAGLMCAIQAARRDSGRRIVLLDSADRIGAKVLVSGGGRCNVTHERVEASDFAGSSRKAIEKVLRRFDVEETVAFFRELGVELKREETGKLFPTTDRARTVLDALLRAAREAGVEVRNPRRVTRVDGTDGGYRV